MTPRQSKIKLKGPLVKFAKLALWKISPNLLNRLYTDRHPQTFSIAIYRGASPFSLEDPEDVANPVLTAADVTDLRAAFVADPFMIHRDRNWYIFFEAFDSILRRGKIGVAQSTDCRNWQYRGIALKEPFHIAYPRVFERENELFMVPDTPGQGARLYRAVEFPLRWRYHSTLIEDVTVVDPTVFRHQDHWWLFAGGITAQGATMPLRLFHAHDVLGPWTEHRASPVQETNERSSRPSGSVAVIGDHLYRFAQDGVPVYGSRVRAFEITDLTMSTYHEQELPCSPLLEAGTQQWNSGGMHHLDAHQFPDGKWTACVDGWYST